MPIFLVLIKQKLLTRTAVTIILLVLGGAGLVGASVYLVTTYYANNRYPANNQMPATGASLHIETSQSQYKVGEQIMLK